MKLFALLLCMAATLVVASGQFVDLFYSGQGQPTKVFYGRCTHFLNSARAPPMNARAPNVPALCNYYRDDTCQTTYQGIPPLMVHPGRPNPIRVPNPPPRGIVCHPH